MQRAQANEASLAASLERLKDELEGTNSASVNLRELERDVQASRSVYEAFLVRTREVSEQERLDTTNIRVIAAPDLPENRSFPPRTLILLAAGAMLGGMLGVALAFFGEWRDRRRPAHALAVDTGRAPVAAPPYVPAAPVAARPRQPSPPVAPPMPESTRQAYAPLPQAAPVARKQAVPPMDHQHSNPASPNRATAVNPRAISPARGLDQ
jgi:G-rich domain on putative tyrosine kinase